MGVLLVSAMLSSTYLLLDKYLILWYITTRILLIGCIQGDGIVRLYHIVIVLSSLFMVNLAHSGQYDLQRDSVVPLLYTATLANSKGEMYEMELPGCSAVRISHSHYLTAAHCLGHMLDAQGNKVPPIGKKTKYRLDGETKLLTIQKIDYKVDLALLYKEKGFDPWPVARFARGLPERDEQVYGIGYPVSDDVGSVQVLTTGTYQGVDKTVYFAEAVIHTSHVAPGMSGGGLFNSTGELVGITSAQADVGDGMFEPYQRVWFLCVAVGIGTVKLFLRGEDYGQQRNQPTF